MTRRWALANTLLIALLFLAFAVVWVFAEGINRQVQANIAALHTERVALDQARATVTTQLAGMAQAADTLARTQKVLNDTAYDMARIRANLLAAQQNRSVTLAAATTALIAAQRDLHAQTSEMQQQTALLAKLVADLQQVDFRMIQRVRTK